MLSVHALEAALHAVLGGAECDGCGGVEGEGRQSHADSEVVEVDEEAVERCVSCLRVSETMESQTHQLMMMSDMVKGALSTRGLTIELSLERTSSSVLSISSTRWTSSMGAMSREAHGPAAGRPV